MMTCIFMLVVGMYLGRICGCSDLKIENLVLRQQIIVLSRKNKRPWLNTWDRLFWSILSWIWKRWWMVLVIVKPETVVKWHRQGFKLFWRYKSRQKAVGRPGVSREVRSLIIKMSNANPMWGAPRIHGELLKLGIDISERTVTSILKKNRPKGKGQIWKTFLKNHMHETCAMDFFTVSTAAFKVIFVLIILSHDRRKLIHFNVTEHPSAEWTSKQIKEAFPWDTAPTYLLRDRDSIYGKVFQDRVRAIGIQEQVTSAHSPWQNPYAERVIGSIRRECLDHIIVLNKRHLKRIVASYSRYYNNDRTHCGLGKDTPCQRKIENKIQGKAELVATPRVGGLHHRYEWREAA